MQGLEFRLPPLLQPPGLRSTPRHSALLPNRTRNKSVASGVISKPSWCTRSMDKAIASSNFIQGSIQQQAPGGSHALLLDPDLLEVLRSQVWGLPQHADLRSRRAVGKAGLDILKHGQELHVHRVGVGHVKVRKINKLAHRLSCTLLPKAVAHIPREQQRASPESVLHDEESWWHHGTSIQVRLHLLGRYLARAVASARVRSQGLRKALVEGELSDQDGQHACHVQLTRVLSLEGLQQVALKHCVEQVYLAGAEDFFESQGGASARPVEMLSSFPNSEMLQLILHVPGHEIVDRHVHRKKPHEGFGRRWPDDVAHRCPQVVGLHNSLAHSLARATVLAGQPKSASVFRQLFQGLRQRGSEAGKDHRIILQHQQGFATLRAFPPGRQVRSTATPLARRHCDCFPAFAPAFITL
eukprot:s74_g15.t2